MSNQEMYTLDRLKYLEWTEYLKLVLNNYLHEVQIAFALMSSTLSANKFDGSNARPEARQLLVIKQGTGNQV